MAKRTARAKGTRKLRVVEPKIKGLGRRAAAVRKASGRVRTRTSIDFVRSVRG